MKCTDMSVNFKKIWLLWRNKYQNWTKHKTVLEKIKRLNNSLEHRKYIDTLGSGNSDSLNCSVLNSHKKMVKIPEEESFK